MLKMSDVIKLRDEVLKGEVSGWINLRGLFKHGREADPKYIFEITYPSVEIKKLINALDQRIKGKRRQGFFEIIGGYGTGKSHILLLLYHLFKNPEDGRKWLKRNGLTLTLPANAKVLAIQLMDEPPKYLWEPIFRGLGCEELLRKVEIYPGASLLKQALQNKDFVVVIIDELESWYKSIESESDKEANLNFLQVLAEVACEEKSNLLVFCALYGEVSDITTRIGRVGPYRADLTLSKDRPKIVLFRLIERVLDKGGINKIAESYIEHYRKSELEVPEKYPIYKKRIAEYYPIHPELMNLLLTKYSSSPYYQNTRGVLYLLSSVIRKKCESTDLLLTSDIDMDEEDLLELGVRLVENAKKDAELIGDPLVRRILNVILLHSFGEEKGASREDVMIGVLRPGINVNDVDEILINLPNMAPHVWPRDGKYVIRHEANIMTIIQNTALEHVRRGKIDRALTLIKEKLKRDRSHYVYHPNSEISDYIPDDERVKIVVSLKPLNERELMGLFREREYANTLIVYTPKPEEGDLIKDEDLLTIAERICLCDEHEKEVSGESKRILTKQRSRDEKNLNDKIFGKYGNWVKILKYEPMNNRIGYRLVPCTLRDVLNVINKHYDVETLKTEILSYLKDWNGCADVDEIIYSFKITPGKPIILNDKIVNEAVRSLEKEGRVIVAGKIIWLSEYYQPPSEKIIVEKLERKVPKAVELGIAKKEPSETITKIISKEKVKQPLLIETQEHPTMFSLSVELERKLPEDINISGVKLSFADIEFDDVEKFIKLLKELQKENVTSVWAVLEADIKGKIMDKKELMSLIDRLSDKIALPRGSSVKATVEGE